MFKSPKAIAIVAIIVALVVIGALGGALGEAAGFGFLSSPIPFISIPAEKVVSVGGFVIQNSMIGLWAAGIVVLAFIFLATRKMELVPGRLQNVAELVVEFFASLAEAVAGAKGRRFLPLVMTIFIVVLIANWLNVLPGVGTVGRIETVEEILDHHIDKDARKEIGRLEESGDQTAADEKRGEALVHAAIEEADFRLTVFDGSGGFKFIPLGGRGQGTKVRIRDLFEDPSHPTFGEIERSSVVHAPEDHPELKGKQAAILVPLFRGASTSVITTLAIAIVAMVAVQYWGFRSLGIGYGSKFINVKQGPIYFLVGLLEIISELSRVISFTFRLFGNMFAGEILLIVAVFILPILGVVGPIVIEGFFGLIQAFIFAMLTLVFGALATAGHGEEGHGAEGHH